MNKPQETCQFCTNLHYNQNTRPENLVLLENQHFVMVAGRGPVVWGHVLIIPKQHFYSFASLPNSYAKSFLSILTQVKQLLNAPAYFEFEHGSGIDISTKMVTACGNSINHAHWHVMPLATKNNTILDTTRKQVLQETSGLTSNQITFNDTPSIFPKLKIASKGAPYLIMKHGDDGFIFCENEDLKVPSQILRRLSAKYLLGKDAPWDWKNMDSIQQQIYTSRTKEFVQYFKQQACS